MYIVHSCCSFFGLISFFRHNSLGSYHLNEQFYVTKLQFYWEYQFFQGLTSRTESSCNVNLVEACILPSQELLWKVSTSAVN